MMNPMMTLQTKRTNKRTCEVSNIADLMNKAYIISP